MLTTDYMLLNMGHCGTVTAILSLLAKKTKLSDDISLQIYEFCSKKAAISLCIC